MLRDYSAAEYRLYSGGIQEWITRQQIPEMGKALWQSSCAVLHDFSHTKAITGLLSP